jgi:cation diffusion facilitator CzcD-associated flavoprotein CzcO
LDDAAIPGNQYAFPASNEYRRASSQDRCMTNKALRFVVIGSGMAGILAGVRLREAGYDKVTILEKASAIGGTWRENRYVGLYCDVPAHAYTYSFAPNPDWSGYLAPGPEIRRYFEDVARRYGLYDIMRFNEEVERCSFENGHWTVLSKTGLVYPADIVIAATGVLHHPRMPDIEGLERFQGSSFHSARWPDDIRLEGKRVGIIGNGSTGVQLVSALAGRAARVTHFQRSPQWIMPVENRPYTHEERAAFRANPELVEAMRFDPTYLSNVRRFTDGIADPSSPQMAMIEAICREHFEKSIVDAALREKLRPSYRAACKRLIFSPDYFRMVQRPDVEVVTTRIRRIEPEGVRCVDETLYPLDVLILATGFHADRYMRPIDIRGRGDTPLHTVWAKRPHAYLAISIPEFPNLFMLNGPGGPVGNFSLIDIAERQWGYIAQLIALIDDGECREIAPTQQALAAYEQRRIAAAKGTIFGSGCSSWYLDAEGIPNTWPWSYDTFAEQMSRPDLEAFERVRLMTA